MIEDIKERLEKLERNVMVNQVCFQLLARSVDSLYKFVEPNMACPEMEEVRAAINIANEQTKVDAYVEQINDIANATGAKK